jgi:A/G-specific adenine glycosylase
MLVALRAGEVLLEKRPPAGIWGGLWSLPEFDRARAAQECLARDWGLEAQEVSALEPFEHAFTHFTLEVTPWRARVLSSRSAREGAAAMWLALSDLDGAALPSPVKRLLRSLAKPG